MNFLAILALSMSLTSAQPVAGVYEEEGIKEVEKIVVVGSDAELMPAEKPQSSEKVFEQVEIQPSFPGGQAALMQWLCNNLRYPKTAMENGIQGKVIVKFVVCKDGSVANPVVVRGVSPELGEEALRIVKKMPKWTPGKNNGNAVNCYFYLPINFKLQGE